MKANVAGESGHCGQRIIARENNMADDEDENIKRTKERCKRFTERVNLNITEAGKLAQQMIKSSKSQEVSWNVGILSIN